MNLNRTYAFLRFSLSGTSTADVGIVIGIYDDYRTSFMVSVFNSEL